MERIWRCLYQINADKLKTLAGFIKNTANKTPQNPYFDVVHGDLEKRKKKKDIRCSTFGLKEVIEDIHTMVMICCPFLSSLRSLFIFFWYLCVCVCVKDLKYFLFLICSMVLACWWVEAMAKEKVKIKKADNAMPESLCLVWDWED